MKKPVDLAEDEFLEITRLLLADGTLIRVEVRLFSTKTGNVRFPKGKSDQDHHAQVTQIFLSPGPKVWIVESVDASEAGWGPFLYDVAMELANLKGCGLRSHESNVTEHARKVWDFYYSNRNDVTHKGLPRTAKRPKKAGALRYMYFKTTPTFLHELVALGKLREREVEAIDAG